MGWKSATGIRLSVAALMLTVALVPTQAFADLVNPSVIFDTPTLFTAELEDHLLTIDGIGPAPLMNWEVEVFQRDFDADGAFDDIYVRARHIFSPHFGDDFPGPTIEGGILSVLPGGPLLSYSTSIAHPSAGHFDNLFLEYRAVGAVVSQLEVKIKHSEAQEAVPQPLPFAKPDILPPERDWPDPVPEPSTFTLAALGVLGLAFFGFRRRQKLAL